MFSVDRANAYFATRTIGAKWDEYSAEQKDAALTQAARDLARALGRPMAEDAAEYQPGAPRCDEYAVYEQACYALLRDALPRSVTGADLPSLDNTDAKPPARSLARGDDWLSAEARRWLGIYQQVRISRG